MGSRRGLGVWQSKAVWHASRVESRLSKWAKVLPLWKEDPFAMSLIGTTKSQIIFGGLKRTETISDQGKRHTWGRDLINVKPQVCKDEMLTLI